MSGGAEGGDGRRRLGVGPHWTAAQFGCKTQIGDRHKYNVQKIYGNTIITKKCSEIKH